MTTATLTPPATDLEPSLAFGGTYVTRRRVTYIDAAALLSVMLVAISMIPARLVVPSMTDLGRPGLIVGFMLFCWWVLVRFSSHLVMTGPQPMRWGKSKTGRRCGPWWRPCATLKRWSEGAQPKRSGRSQTPRRCLS